MIIIIDIGKTNIKLFLLDSQYKPCAEYITDNRSSEYQNIRVVDVDYIWHWLIDNIKTICLTNKVSSIAITTHGATCALVDNDAGDEHALAFPIIDYESTNIYTDCADYHRIRPSFSDTHSPNLPAGLNLGRQLFWVKKFNPQAFERTTDILMYPQYWVYRLTGIRCNEITSIGCHTDLWSFSDNQYSTLVNHLGIENKLPDLVNAWDKVATISDDLKETLQIKHDINVYAGIHDSNASFLRYLKLDLPQDFAVLSTGTWCIAMSSATDQVNMYESKDMLANLNVFREPIYCSRFKGGEEYEVICHKTGNQVDGTFDIDDVRAILESEIYALPEFSNGCGPFAGHQPKFIGNISSINGVALAAIYCALVIDYQLNLLNSKGVIFIEGAFLKNTLLCEVIATLRKEQTVYRSNDETGTVIGTSLLTKWNFKEAEIVCSVVSTLPLDSIQNYKLRWLDKIRQNIKSNGKNSL